MANMFSNVIESFNKKNDEEKIIKIDNLVKIDGYEAGKYGNLLVTANDNLCIARLERTKGLIFEKKAATVKPMICTAFVKDPADQAKLRKYCDDRTSPGMIIVVNKAFMSLFFMKPYKVVLLEAQSAKSNMAYSDEITVLEQATVQEYCAAYENHWKSTVKHAMGVRDKKLAKQLDKFAKAQKRETKLGNGNRWTPTPVGHVRIQK